MATRSVTRTASDALLAKWSALDSGYRPVGHHGVVYETLLQEMATEALQREGICQKRQSPLVNAGYAARIACMTEAVESFLSFHKSTSGSASAPPLQVVLLGCGLDVLGLWALSHSPETIKVFEVDVLDIIMTKKDLLESMEWLQIVSTKSKEDDEMISIEGVVSAAPMEKVNYTLASCDLKDASSVEKALGNVDRSIPTLVLSELVLAYLGRNGIDELLILCSSSLCVAPGSVFAAYEALGPSSDNDAHVRSVVDGYKCQYSKKFREKLKRGMEISNEDEATDEDAFHPLGDCPNTVQKRISTDGFEWSFASLAGTVAACVFDNHKRTGGGRSFTPCEPFDEHAALALHLNSYVYICSFAEQTEIDLIRSLCPWSSISLVDMEPKVVCVDDGSEVCIRPIRAKDQKQTQELFLGTYQDLSKHSSPVKKMVKTALKTDLKCSPDEIHSSIGLRYQTCGGVFLVAVEEGGWEANTVIGCLGIRLCKTGEGGIRGGALENTFEIHRLAVEENARGRGIGKTLLRIAEEEFIQPGVKGGSYRIVATTPSLMKRANPLYTASGFVLEKQQVSGDMTINTYVKERSKEYM